MASYQQRRRADFELWAACNDVARDRNESRKTRRAARQARRAFWIRLRFGWHDPPNKRAKVLSFGFRYGRYGGVGHGIPAGETRPAIDRLDRAFLAHDKAYASIDELEAWFEAQNGRPNR